jgi:hypothetical protein
MLGHSAGGQLLPASWLKGSACSTKADRLASWRELPPYFKQLTSIQGANCTLKKHKKEEQTKFFLNTKA